MNGETIFALFVMFSTILVVFSIDTTINSDKNTKNEK